MNAALAAVIYFFNYFSFLFPPPSMVLLLPSRESYRFPPLKIISLADNWATGFLFATNSF